MGVRGEALGESIELEKACDIYEEEWPGLTNR